MRMIIQAEALRRSEKTHHHQFIHELPTIEAVQVVHAYWYGSEFDGYADGNPVYDTWGCSHCHEEVSAEGFPPAYDYCPNCGAKMDGGAQE